MSWTMVSSFAIVRAAGKHVNQDIVHSAAFLEDVEDKAVGQLCEALDFDLSGQYATIPLRLRPAIAKAVASIAAMELIAYDPTGYLSSENQLILDVMNNNIEKLIGSMKNRGKKFNKLDNG